MTGWSGGRWVEDWRRLAVEATDRTLKSSGVGRPSLLMVRLWKLPSRETRIKALKYFLFRIGDRHMHPVYVFLDAATLTEVFPCLFLTCKANARV